MKLREITQKEQKAYNKLVDHPLQSFEWGEFRQKTGVKVLRLGIFEKDTMVGGFTLTIHTLPKTSYKIGYLPKGLMPDKALLKELKIIGKKEKCIFIQLEPNVKNSDQAKNKLLSLGLKSAAHPLFTKFTFVLDLTPSEDELMKSFHSKTRYNIRVAERHGVTVSERNTPDAFASYIALTEETTKRQKFYAHTRNYHEIQWETLPHIAKSPFTTLSSHLLLANYNKKTLASWILFVFKDTLYYPYGASSNEHRETMSSNLIMWEAIKFGKRLGLKKFDMWGALGTEPDTTDTWYGFHRFKQGYHPEHVEFVGSYDLVISRPFYQIYKIADKLRWLLLRIKK